MISFERANEYNNISSENYSKNLNTFKKDEEINDNELIQNKFNQNFKFKNGKIQFKNYSLKYKPDGKFIMKEMNFTINSGEKIAVMGSTGCGNSTLIYAITRLIESSTGKILIDDIDISSIPLQILRKNIGILSQNNVISEGTFQLNLDPLNKYSKNEIIDALKKLDYWYNKEEIEEFGLNDYIEENGANLSLAQKSLIGVTKLLLKKECRIIILDDLGSFLDGKTQEIVYKAIYSSFQNITIIILTHEIKSYMEIDRVMTIQEGFIKEFDILENLESNKNSLFYKLQNYFHKG